MQDLLQILLFPSLKTSKSCKVSKFSTSTISLLNNAKTFSFRSLDKFSIFAILLKLRSSHSKLSIMSRPEMDSMKLLSKNNLVRFFKRDRLSILTIFINSNLYRMMTNSV